MSRIVVTGIGPLSSVGIGKDNFWQGIVDRRLNLELEEYSVDGQLWDKFYAHRIKDFDIHKFGIEEDKLDAIREWKEGEEIIDLNYLIAAVKLALDDSRIDYEKEDNNIGLVLAHENLGLMPFGLKASQKAYEMLVEKKQGGITKKDFYEKLYYSFFKTGYDVQTFADLFHIAKVFNIHNYSLFINNACASGLYAFEAASQIIKSNQAKAVVVAASDFPDIYKYVWFRDLGIYSPDGIVRPFCKDSNGLVFGEAGIGLVLEDLDYALSRDAAIYAEYLGAGFNLEGWRITAPEIGSDSYQKAFLKAFEQAGIDKESVDLVCPHGVGSQPIDYYESKAITDIFGLNPSRPFITTFKPYVGHSLGASALLESAVAILSLKNDFIPPTLNCINIDPKFNIALVKEGLKAELNTVMKICCAFAGFNSAAIFRKPA